jgi:endo-1,4-beta-xylanase
MVFGSTLLLTLPFFNCAQNVVATAALKTGEPQYFKDALLKKNIRFGTCLSVADIQNRDPRPPGFMQSLSQYFNYYSMSVSFSMVERSRGNFDFTVPDAICDFAKANNAKVKGHSLILVGAIPDWLKNGNFSSDELSAILKTHIQTIVTHFKDKYPDVVTDWQVVNEAVCNGGANLDATACPQGIKNVVWTNIHKPGSNDPRDYISLAFEWAHEANPNAKLYLNEDGNEWDVHPKKQRIYDLVSYLVKNHVPINGVGMEGHVRTYFKDKITLNGLVQTFNSYADLGLESQITETDVLLSTGAEPNTSPTRPIAINSPGLNDFKTQADLYSMLLEACIKAKNCTAFTLGASYDPASWTQNYWKGREFYSQLLDNQVKPKIAYQSMLETVRKYDKK